MNYPRRRNPDLLVMMMASCGAMAIMQACAGSAPPSDGTGGSANLGTDSSIGGDNGSGGAASDTGGATNSDCPAGSERCDCYGNGTCNDGLVCASQICVDLAGFLAGAGGATSASGSGGATVNGGSNTGVTSAGGSPAGNSTGGTTMPGAATGGVKATGGAPASGGAKATGGAPATGGNTFWNTNTYSSTGSPNPPDGHHNAGQNCIQCHVSGSSSGAPVWMFGGTVYQSNGTTPAANVEIGINDGTNLYTTYSATNGNFWVAGSSTINWAKAQVRIRNANGELTMAGATPASTCNLCHSSTTYPRITAP